MPRAKMTMTRSNTKTNTSRSTTYTTISARTTLSLSPLSLVLAVLLLLSPSVSFTTHMYNEWEGTFTQQHQQQHHQQQQQSPLRIPWATAAVSPASDAVAAAAALRRNVISGAAIFTAGDVAAQILFPEKSIPTVPSTVTSTVTSTATATAIPHNRNKRALSPSSSSSSSSTENESDTESENESENDEALSLPLSTALVAPSRKLQQLLLQQQQHLQKALSSLDKNRLGSAMVLGAIWSGFCVPLVYGAVEQRFPGKATLKQVLTKVLVTCSILSTIGNYCTMFARRWACECLSHQFDKTASLRFEWNTPTGVVRSLRLLLATTKGCARSCNRDILEVVADDLKIWPIYDLTCYGLIPPNWRPITTSIMSSGWAMYMSAVSARESGSIDEDDEEELDGVAEIDVKAVAVKAAAAASTATNTATNTNTATAIEKKTQTTTTTTKNKAGDTSTASSTETETTTKRLPPPPPPVEGKGEATTTAATNLRTTQRLVRVAGGANVIATASASATETGATKTDAVESESDTDEYTDTDAT